MLKGQASRAYPGIAFYCSIFDTYHKKSSIYHMVHGKIAILTWHCQGDNNMLLTFCIKSRVWVKHTPSGHLSLSSKRQGIYILRNLEHKISLPPTQRQKGFTGTCSHDQKQLELYRTVQNWKFPFQHCHLNEAFSNIAKRPHCVNIRCIVLFQIATLVKAFYCEKNLFSFIAFKGNEPIKTQNHQRLVHLNEQPRRWIIKGHQHWSNPNTTVIS